MNNKQGNQNENSHLIARFKAKIRAVLMKKERALTSIDLIKAGAMQIEEKIKKSALGTNGTNVNFAKQVFIKQVSKEDQFIENLSPFYTSNH